MIEVTVLVQVIVWKENIYRPSGYFEINAGHAKPGKKYLDPYCFSKQLSLWLFRAYQKIT